MLDSKKGVRCWRLGGWYFKFFVKLGDLKFWWL